MDDINYTQEMTFESSHCMSDQIYGEKAVQKLNIYPNNNRAWTYTLLSAFLNELVNFRKPSRRGFVILNDYGKNSYKFVFIHRDIAKFFINIKINEEIEVLASLEWLKREWEIKHMAEQSLLRKGGKFGNAPKIQMLDFFTLTFPNISSGTKCLYSHTHIMYCSFCDFSTVFHFFAKHVMKNGLQNNIDTLSIHEYFDVFCVAQKNGVSSLESLKTKLHGYIQFDIQECSQKRKLAQINHNGKRNYNVNWLIR